MSTKTIDEVLPGGARVQGEYAAGFAPVVEAFRRNFTEEREAGASVCLTHKGATVVDVWGGVADPATGRPWERDTIAIAFSCTKGAAALVANMLAERGQVSLYDDVACVWPEFAQNGKAGTTLAMMLSHTSPVPHVRDPIKPGGLFDWDYMVERVAAEPAWWAPGAQLGYHGYTFAWTVGQVIRRATGRTLGQIFREDVAAPLGVDFWIGLPEEHEPRVAAQIPPDPSEADRTSKLFQALQDPNSLTSLMMRNSGGVDVNTRAARAGELASFNGIGNARALARMYAPLANGGGGLVNEDTIARMSRVIAATHEDASMHRAFRFGLGFMGTTGERGRGGTAIMGERAFGHVGSGGSIGFADPEAQLSLGYVMNRSGAGGLLDRRGQGLVDASYAALGWRGSASGAWRR